MGEVKTVLVVDDEDVLRRVTKTGLQRGGFHVLEARTSQEATQVWIQHRESIDLLITDITLADSQATGLELAWQLRADDPTLPIVVASGNAPESYSSDVAELDPCVALPKPFTLPDLITIAHQLTRQQD